jgi:hypothetical protein
MEGGGITVVLAFYMAYFMGSVCPYAGLSYAFGLKIALLLFGAMQVGCVLLVLAHSFAIFSSGLCWGYGALPFQEKKIQTSRSGP